MIFDKELDVCCLQEINIPCSFNHELLSFGVYDLLIKNNDTKASVNKLACICLDLLDRFNFSSLKCQRIE